MHHHRLPSSFERQEFNEETYHAETEDRTQSAHSNADESLATPPLGFGDLSSDVSFNQCYGTIDDSFPPLTDSATFLTFPMPLTHISRGSERSPSNQDHPSIPPSQFQNDTIIWPAPSVNQSPDFIETGAWTSPLHHSELVGTPTRMYAMPTDHIAGASIHGGAMDAPLLSRGGSLGNHARHFDSFDNTARTPPHCPVRAGPSTGFHPHPPFHLPTQWASTSGHSSTMYPSPPEPVFRAFSPSSPVLPFPTVESAPSTSVGHLQGEEHHTADPYNTAWFVSGPAFPAHSPARALVALPRHLATQPAASTSHHQMSLESHQDAEVYSAPPHTHGQASTQAQAHNTNLESMESEQEKGFSLHTVHRSSKQGRAGGRSNPMSVWSMPRLWQEHEQNTRPLSPPRRPSGLRPCEVSHGE
ncbi:hypothetical protein OF83DRAFT_1177042 [Amylostereum chailletii]|nr:hypothetical protein OF83DRAFT_1177042 [Amylostereum chailletii]